MPSPEIPTLRAIFFKDTAVGSFGEVTATVATAKGPERATESASQQGRWPPFVILFPTAQPSDRSRLKTAPRCWACDRTAIARKRRGIRLWALTGRKGPPPARDAAQPFDLPALAFAYRVLRLEAFSVSS